MSASLAANPPFVRLYVARTASILGEAAAPVILSAVALDAGYGAAGVGYVFGAPILGSLLFLAVGGALSDRIFPRRIMVAADLARVLLFGLLAVQASQPEPQLWALLVVQFLVGIANAMFQPGVSSMVVNVAHGHEQRANGALKVSESLCQTLGPAFGGFVLVWANSVAVLVVIGVLFGVSGLLLSGIRDSGLVPRNSDESFVHSLRIGWSEFTSRSWLVAVISVFSLLGLFTFGPFLVLGAVVLTDNYGSATYGVMMSLLGLGAVLGGVAGMRITVRRPLFGGTIAMFGMVPVLLLLPLEHGIVPIGIAMFVTGAVRAFWSVMWTTTVQVNVPPAVLNRVYSYDVAGSWLMLPAGRVAAGQAAEVFAPGPVLGISALALVLGMVLLLCSRTVRRLENPRSRLAEASGTERT